MNKFQNFKNRRIGILGLGEENIALVKYLVGHGAANITICDQKSREELGEYYRQVKDLPVQFRLGSHYLDHLRDFKLVFRTPGLPYLNTKIQEAKKKGVEVSSQTKLFFELCPCPIIGVTGTKGKGTTATLISEILKWKSKIPTFAKAMVGKHNQKSKIYLGGNIGTSPIEFLDKLNPTDWVILELSSFQLQDLEQSPHISVVLDIKIDHLDYHRSRNEYIEAKSNILRYQNHNDFAVINADYFTSIEMAISTKAKIFWFSRRKSVDLGSFLLNGELILRTENNEYPIVKVSEIQLRGEHNLENVSAAISASYLADADIASIKLAVKEFKGLEYRLEFVGVYNGIKFYNDSFSTTPDTTIAAIDSFKEPIILLLGGSEKGADYRLLGRVISQSSVKTIIKIGATADRIIKNLTNSKIKINESILDMPSAFRQAVKAASKGEVVLLSPASASFDKYKNYKERGHLFEKAFRSLK